MNNKTKYTIPFLALILLIPIGMTNSFAQENQEEFEYNVYTIEEIEHAFAVMEEYVIYDENKNITFDIINTINNPDVTQFDIDVALDFAVHNNDIMDAVIGFTGQVNETQTSENEQLKQALEELENGKFRALFGSETGSVGSVSDITFTTYDFAHTPIISAFGIYEYAKIHQTQHSSSSSTLACGGNYQNPHPVDSTPTTTTTSGFSSLGDAQQELYQNGYHMVPSYASWGGESAQDIDFAKVVTSGAPGNCNNGPFRDEAVINPYTHSSYTVTEDEPNPEILSYWWPKLWWGVYVEWWHDRF